MGLFDKKPTRKSVIDDAKVAEFSFFDDAFREELRNHGRRFFEKVIKENGSLFKNDLDHTITNVNGELKDHIVAKLDASITKINAELREEVIKQLAERFDAYDKGMKEVQDVTLQSIQRSTQVVEQQQQQLSVALKTSFDTQQATLTTASQETNDQIATMKQTQELAQQSLAQSAQALETQYQQLTATIQEGVAKQQEILIGAFHDNMARVIEHYLVGALADQYDLKGQLPSIIRHMEANKQALVDDMKL